MAKTQWIRTDGGRAEAGIIERNDCAVRAYAMFTGKPYAEAHATFSRLGRRQFKGTTIHTIATALQEFPRTKLWINSPRTTLSQVAKKFPVGKVYMVKRGHAFTMIDGVVHDSLKVGATSVINDMWIDPVSTSAAPKVETPVVAAPKTRVSTNKKDIARVIFDRLNAYGTLSRHQIAKRMASEMNITVANASYYCTRVFA